MTDQKPWRKSLLSEYGTVIALCLLLVFLSILTKGDFLTSRNLTNLFRQMALNGILACGMTVIIITSGIDLSIGSIVALSGVTIGLVQTQPILHFADMGLFGAGILLLIGVGIGATSGLISGTLIASLGIAPFIISLGMMVIARGLALIISDGQAISPMSEDITVFANAYFGGPLFLILMGILLSLTLFILVKFYGQAIFKKSQFWIITSILLILLIVFHFHKGFPVLLMCLIVVALFSHYLLNLTVFGRSVYAIGSNQKAAALAGVQINKRLMQAYALMGAYGGLVGVLLAARLNSADPNAGQLFELDAIAAVVIGGTSLKGGKGTIFGTLVGALMIAALNNGMDLLSVPSFYQMVLKGVIIIVASLI